MKPFLPFPKAAKINLCFNKQKKLPLKIDFEVHHFNVSANSQAREFKWRNDKIEYFIEC